MKGRCRNPNNDHFKWYGDKGVKVCDEWNKFENFRDWAISNGYESNLTIDRIDSNGDYKPDNCQWITRSENTRKASVEMWEKRRKRCTA